MAICSLLINRTDQLQIVFVIGDIYPDLCAVPPVVDKAGSSTILWSVIPVVRTEFLLGKLACAACPTNPEPIPKIQIGERQVSEYQEGTCSVDWAMKLGAVDYLAKPVAPDNLEKLIRETQLEGKGRR